MMPLMQIRDRFLVRNSQLGDRYFLSPGLYAPLVWTASFISEWPGKTKNHRALHSPCPLALDVT